MAFVRVSRRDLDIWFVHEYLKDLKSNLPYLCVVEDGYEIARGLLRGLAGVP